MLSRLWVARLVTITALVLPAGWLGLSVPGAQAGTVRSAATPGSIRAAAVGRAPLVANAAPPHSKRGLPAPPMTPAMRRANAAKQAMARKFLARKHQLARKHALDRKHALAGQHGQARKRALARPDAKCVRRSCLSGLPAARSLAATQQPQITNYFCGPATVSEMLHQVGAKVSQAKAARQLGTTAGGTDWSNGAGYPVPSVLNADQKRNTYVAVALPWSPTNAQVRTYEIDLVTDLNRNGGAPLAGNAYEIPGGPHLVGHPPNQSISHWFDIRGYSKSGAITQYEDSVHGAPSIGWSSAVPAYSSLSSRTIVNILGARGYDW
ncbi:MAG: hypothetical protein ABJB47_01860 [Actinomycetota bacterium]